MKVDELSPILESIEPSSLAPASRRRLWEHPRRGYLSFILEGVALCALSFAMAATLALEARVGSEGAAALRSFEWTVLVAGNQLEQDEVGRALRQFPSVDQVVQVTPEESFEKLQTSELIFGDLTFFSPSDLPSSWRVSWLPTSLSVNNWDDVFADVRRIPGVLDVAYDRGAIDHLRFLQRLQFHLRATFSILVLFSLILGLTLIGRYLFSSGSKRLNGAELTSTIVADALFWLAGYLVARQTIGDVTWAFVAGGIAAGFLHTLWLHRFRARAS